MLRLDGAAGEGGGQIVRTALALATATGRPLRMEGIRESRNPPGLRAQHLTALRAAAEISGAEVTGARMESRTVEFRPGRVRPGRYRFDTGGAGSAVLVLQTVLPPLLAAGGESVVDVEGGTHNPLAPPYEFLAGAFLPLLNRGTRRVEPELVRPGFYPAGGGHLRARISAAPCPAPLELVARGPVSARRVRAVVSDLPRHIAEREASTAHAFLELRPDAVEVVEIPDPRGPGNAVMVEVETPSHTEVFTGFGRKGVPAKEVALEACREARDYLDSDAPVGRHLADQLLLPLVLEEGGVFRTTEITSHTRTNATVIRDLTGASIEFRDRDGTVEVEVDP